MNKSSFLFIALFCHFTVFGQSNFSNLSQRESMLLNSSQLSQQQLLDTANYYFTQNSFDTALIYYNMIINTPVKEIVLKKEKTIVDALNKSAVIYYWMSDYRSSYDYLIKALLLCEKIDYISYEPRIYSNIGNIYYHYNNYEMAKAYYSKALFLSEDSANTVMILNNLGSAELENGNLDSAFYYLTKSLQISKRHNDIYTHIILNTMGSIYQKNGLYDSAFYFFRLSLNEAKKNQILEFEAEILSGLGKLCFELNRPDSALFYINASNTLAKGNIFLNILTKNYLTLSKIEESKGNIKKAFEYYKEYANLQDSVFNAEKFGEISQLQRLYEVSKTNQQIEELTIEQQIKERTIHYQKIIGNITLGVLLLVSAGFLFIFLQNRRLNKAYRALVEKNIEIFEFQDNLSEQYTKKYKKSALTQDLMDELLKKILKEMEHVSVICDPDFSIDKLAESVHSNRSYVSQVVNLAIKKNFRSFLNSYRIREAQRIFSKLDTAKYSIDSIAQQVGFKSQSTFYEAFKEITGVSPNFYLKSIREQKSIEK